MQVKVYIRPSRSGEHWRPRATIQKDTGDKVVKDDYLSAAETYSSITEAKEATKNQVLKNLKDEGVGEENIKFIEVR